MKEGFNSLNIEIDNDQFISKILSFLKDHGIHDKRKDSIHFVMQYAKKFSPKMTILNKDFLDRLEKRIEAKTLLGQILIDDEDDCIDSIQVTFAACRGKRQFCGCKICRSKFNAAKCGKNQQKF